MPQFQRPCLSLSLYPSPCGAWWLSTIACLAALACGAARAHGQAPTASMLPPIELTVPATLPSPPPGVAALKFGEMFSLPVGPRGLVASPRLQALHGQPVRLVGYMAQQAVPTAGRLILAPMPVSLGDEDEPMADDLPPTAVFVHLADGAQRLTLPHLQGLVQLQGRLDVGPQTEPDGHVSMVRLLLDDATTRPLAALALPPALAMPTAGR